MPVDRAYHLRSNARRLPGVVPGRPPRHAAPRGYSLVEVVVSSLIVGGLLAGALDVVGGVYATHRTAADRFQELQLAELLLAEIAALPYEDPQQPGGPIGVESGESTATRQTLDDVDDYHLWNRLPAEAIDGSVLPGAAGWRRQVSVVYIDPSTGATLSDDLGAKKIVVSVTAPGGAVVSLETIRSKWGALEQRPDDDALVVTSVEASLQPDASLPPVTAAATLKNHATDQ